MSKTRQPQEQQAQQDAQSSERSGPTLSSNDTEQASLGLEGQGADASEFGLGGSFAATILECMPTMPALMMAKRFAHNPAVMAWADGISLAEVADELSFAANTLLKEVWPVGTGLQAETELAMSALVGGNARGQVTAMRQDADTLHTRMDTQASMAWEGVGAGLSTKDAFGADVLSAGADAGLHLHADISASRSSDFDVVSLLKGSALGALRLSNIISPAGSSLAVALTHEHLSTQVEQAGGDWDMEFALSARGVAQVSSDQLLADEHREALMTEASLLGVEAGEEAHILPLLKLSAEYGLTIRAVDGGLVLEGQVQSQQALGKLAATPILADALGGLSEEAMDGVFGASGSSELRLVVKDPTDMSLDVFESGFSLKESAESRDGTVEMEQFLSLATLSEVSTTDLTIQGALADAKKSVKIVLDPAQIDDHLSDVMKQVLGFADGVLPEQSSLSLEGEAFLSAERVNRVIGDRALQGLERPQLLMEHAIDMAMGGTPALSGDLALYSEHLSQMAEMVEFGGARLKGQIRQGLGGGVDATVPAGSAGGTIRAAGGIVIDKTVDAEQVQRLREALSGGQLVA